MNIDDKPKFTWVVKGTTIYLIKADDQTAYPFGTGHDEEAARLIADGLNGYATAARHLLKLQSLLAAANERLEKEIKR